MATLEELTVLSKGRGEFDFEKIPLPLLIYKRSNDGGSAEHFRRKVDGNPNVLCIISTKDNVFGGYTKTGWTKGEETKIKDEKAFIFSIV